MFLITIPIVFFITATNGFTPLQPESAASEAQIKFAVENKYDNTGPATKQENAHKTFKNLDDALVAYLDDPDTKLPESEKARAYERLTNPIKTGYGDIQHSYKLKHTIQPQSYYLNTPENYIHNKHPNPSLPPISVIRYTFPDNTILNHEPGTKHGIFDVKDSEGLKNSGILKGLDPSKGFNFRGYEGLKPFNIDGLNGRESFRLKQIKPIRESPLSLGHFKISQQDIRHEHVGDFNPNPHYTFSYGVHDKHTGDSKSAHESREGGVVRGYYTVIDADGQQRTVRYTADDRRGFRAEVQRSPTNVH